MNTAEIVDGLAAWACGACASARSTAVPARIPSAWRSPVGRIRMSIGLREPDVGSDLSRTAMRAEKVDGGFLVSGRKTWSETRWCRE